MSYNYLIDSYRKLPQKNRNGDRGLRIVLAISDETVYLVKKFIV